MAYFFDTTSDCNDKDIFWDILDILKIYAMEVSAMSDSAIDKILILMSSELS